MIANKNITKVFYLFLFFHLFLWTLVPSISNVNLPLDTIEALAWASNLEWGYNKHPPLSAYIVGSIYFLFGANDWAYYLLSQIFVIIAFIYIWKLSKEFFKNRIFSLLSLVILEGIFFFNYTTPEFNVYVCQLPLKALVAYFFWKGINDKRLINWIMTGLFSALGILTHYSFVFLILSLLVFFIFFVKKNKDMIKNFFLSFIIFILLISPHLFWLVENNFSSIFYAINRTGIEDKIWINHFYNPIIFLLKQLGMLVLFFIIFFSIFSFNKNKNIKFKTYDKKNIFLLCISLLPILIVFFVSVISGAKIRTMWMSTFYLFFGIFFFYYFKNKINLKKIINYLYIVVFIFFLIPITYLYVSLNNDNKRTDFPGQEIARLVQNKWDDNFRNNIKIVVGDEWFAGNLSYHLKSRPAWFIDLKNKSSEIENNQGVIYVGNPEILKKICPGVFGKIAPVGYCMIGRR